MAGTAVSRRAKALRDLCRESAAILAGLGLPATFTLVDLHAAVEERRGRNVHLIPQHMPSRGPCGLWISGDHADYVFYDSTTSPIHRHAVIGHEFGHMLFDDGSTTAESAELAALLLPDLDPGALPRLLSRTTYAEHREWRAEIFASVVVQRLGGWSEAPLPSTADPLVLARLVAALEPPA